MNCPYCAEEIKDEAITCRYCGANLVLPKRFLDELESVKGDIENMKSMIANLLEKAPSNPILLNSSQRQISLSGLKITGIKPKIILIFFISVLAFLALYWFITQFNPKLPIIGDVFSPAGLIITMSLIAACAGYFMRRAWPEPRIVYFFAAGILFGFISDFSDSLVYYGWDWRSIWGMYNNMHSLRISLLFLLTSALACVSGALIAQMLTRFRNPDKHDAGLSGQVASYILSRTNASAATRATRLKAFADVMSVMTPVITLLGTFLTAWLGYLGAVAKGTH